MERELIIEQNKTITCLTLNRPKRANALNQSLVSALISAVRCAETDGTRLLCLRGYGERFCSGFDLSGLEKEDDESLAQRFVEIETLLQELYHAPFVTLALANGIAFGAGSDLVGVCEHRIAQPHTKFKMPGLQFGVVLGTSRLAHRVGADTARALLSSSQMFDTEYALKIGFLTQSADENLWESIIEETGKIAGLLDPKARAALNKATTPNTRLADMCALKKSIEPKGLKDRIQNYLAETLSAKSKT